MQDVINDIKVIEEDLENVEKKCEKINCGALYDAIVATIKLIYDLLFCCCKKKLKINNNVIYCFNNGWGSCIWFLGFDFFFAI